MSYHEIPEMKPILCSQGGFAYNGEHIDYWKRRAETAEREVGRLRTAFRVNMLRFGGTDAEIDAVLNATQHMGRLSKC